MPPPKIHDELDDDLDDLDDVLDSLTAKPTASTLSTAAPISPLPPPPSRQAAPPPPAPAEDDIGDPDDVGLDSVDPFAAAAAAEDPELARQLEQGMKALFAGLGGPDSGESEGEAGLPGGMMDDPEFAKIMQEMLKGDFAAPAGAPRAPGAGGDDELQKLMAALGMSADDFALPSEGNNASVASTSKAAAAAAAATTSASSTSPPPPQPPANFQDAIAASMSKLRDSSTTANASRAAASSSGEGGGGGGDSAGMAAMLAQLAGMPGGGLPGLEGLDSDEGLQGMLDDMMKQLMSREMLYEPLKELADKYPAYLSAHGASLATADRDRYEKQRTIVCEIVAAFEEPGADVDPSAKLAPEEEQKRAQRTERVVDLVAKMNECGAPPTEIMGEMPPGMELGPDGAPKVPECCIS
ncbi:Pex19-domain-containing protein [Rhodotorula sp. JG-1b]|nr:Pex19-domain-containing protein [Rhodotorula sp. JG-1b]